MASRLAELRRPSGITVASTAGAARAGYIVEGEAELGFVQSHGAVLSKLRRALVRMGASRARRKPGWEIGLDTCLNKSVL